MTNGTIATCVASKKIVKNGNNKLQLNHYKIRSLVDKNISAFAIYRIVQTNLDDKLENSYKKVKIRSEFSDKRLKK